MANKSFSRRWVISLLGAALAIGGGSGAAFAAFPDLEPFVQGTLGFVKPKGWSVQVQDQGDKGSIYAFAPGPHPPGVVLVVGKPKASVKEAVDLELGLMANVSIIRRWNPDFTEAGAVFDADVAGGRHRVAVLVKRTDETVVGTLLTPVAGDFEALGREQLLRTMITSLHEVKAFPADALRGTWESTSSNGFTLTEIQGGAAIGSISGGSYTRFDFLPGQKYRRVDVVRSVGLAFAATLVTEASGTLRSAGDTITLQEGRCSYRHYDRNNAYQGTHRCSEQPRYLIGSLNPKAGGISFRGLELHAGDLGSAEVALKRPR
jgi:hypothetical protein